MFDRIDGQGVCQIEQDGAATFKLQNITVKRSVAFDEIGAAMDIKCILCPGFLVGVDADGGAGFAGGREKGGFSPFQCFLQWPHGGVFRCRFQNERAEISQRASHLLWQTAEYVRCLCRKRLVHALYAPLINRPGRAPVDWSNRRIISPDTIVAS